MKGTAFEELVERLGSAMTDGDAASAVTCFSESADYADPCLNRFSSRSELVPLCVPGPMGYSIVWHRVLFDEVTQTGVLEYTYAGHHCYHGRPSSSSMRRV